MTITSKIALTCAIIVALTGVSLLIALSTSARLSDDARQLSHKSVPRAALMGDITSELRQYRVAQLERSFVPGESADAKDAEQELEDTAAIVDRDIAQAAR